MLTLLRLLPLFLFYLVAMFLYQGMRVSPQVTEVPLLDRPLPRFETPPLFTGQLGVTSGDFGDQPTLISFFAVDCIPCANQMDALDEFAESRALRLFGIAVGGEANADRARAWLDKVGNPYRIVGQDKLGVVGGAFGIVHPPELILVDAKGRIRFRYAGPVTEVAVKYQLAPAIEQMTR